MKQESSSPGSEVLPLLSSELTTSWGFYSCDSRAQISITAKQLQGWRPGIASLLHFLSRENKKKKADLHGNAWICHRFPKLIFTFPKPCFTSGTKCFKAAAFSLSPDSLLSTHGHMGEAGAGIFLGKGRFPRDCWSHALQARASAD